MSGPGLACKSWATYGALVILFSCFAASANAAVDGAAIVRGSGRIKRQGAHEWQELSSTDVLTAGTTVQAASDQPLEMNLPDGVTVTLEPSSLATWMPSAKLPSETNTWTRGHHLVLSDGELEVRMPAAPKGAHAFLVSTTSGTLTDWRGQLHVFVHGDTAAAAIYEGALVVGSNGHGFPVYDGAGILMKRGVNPDKTRGIPPAPQWSPTSQGFLLQSEGATGGALNLVWDSVASTSSYRLEIATDPSMVTVVDRTTTSDQHYVASLPCTAGKYWAHVRAVGTAGIVGTWSTPQLIRVLRYQLPAGASVASDGAIVLPSGAALTFPDPEGLEVAFESVSSAYTRAPMTASPANGPELGIPLGQHGPTRYWSPLGASIRLPDLAPMRLVHLRDPSSGTEARLLLARRELRADVEMSPRDAVWPRDRIAVQVHLSDPSGRTDVMTEPASVEAFLGLDPLAVEWTRQGSTWSGHIAPRLIADPSVVRVVIKDSHSDEIGRGFMEIAPQTLARARSN